MPYNLTKKKTIIYLFFIISLGLTNACNVNQNSLSGKKLYVIAQGKIGLIVSELELYFMSDNQVKIKITGAYYLSGIITRSKDDLSVAKQMLSSFNGVYPYTYKNDVLTIPNTAFIENKLTKSDDFYTDSKGQLYNDESILNLSKSEKIKRLGQVFNNYSGSIEKEILPNEIVFK